MEIAEEDRLRRASTRLKSSGSHAHWAFSFGLRFPP